MKKLLSVLLLTSAFSANAAVVNGDFELQPQAEGGFTDNDITNWVGSSSSSFSFGVFNSTDAYITGTSAPNANNIAYINSGNISQLLSDSVSFNTLYSLSVDVFSRSDFPTPGWGVELLAGSNVVGSSFAPSGLVNSSVTTTVNYLADNTYVGQLLSVRLSTNGVQTSFDNVQLSVTPVPEAETYAMFLAGLGLLGFAARRKA